MSRVKDMLAVAKEKSVSSQSHWRTVFARGETPATADLGQSARSWKPFRPNGSTAGGVTQQRSLVGADPAQVRLLQALRSRAPGGWTDDRWEQTMRHFVGIQYLAIHRKGMQLSQAEFAVYKKDDSQVNGKRPVKKGEQGFDLNYLLEKPNQAKESFGDLMYQAGQQLDITGSWLTFTVPDMLASKILELYTIPTAMAIPQPVINPDFPDGYWRIQPIYPYGPFSTSPTPSTSVGAPIGGQWMMRCKYQHPLVRYDGYSPMTGLSLQIDEFEQMDRSRWYGLFRFMHPSAVVNFEGMEDAQPLPEPEIQRIRQDFEADQQGTTNAGRILIAPPGAKIEPWGAAQIDMDFQGGWSQMADFILPGFGMTKPAVGMSDASSYSQWYAALKQLHEMTLNPLCLMFGNAITRQIGPYFGDDLIVEIRCKRIDDWEITSKKAEMLASNGAITYNQFLELLDMPLTEEPWGEERMGQQQAMGAGGGLAGPGQQGGAPPPPPLDQAEPEEANPPPAPPEIEKTRPKVGQLSEGSLGPRKSMPELIAERKRLAQRNGMKHLNGKNGHAIRR